MKKNTVDLSCFGRTVVKKQVLEVFAFLVRPYFTSANNLFSRDETNLVGSEG